jgi:deoxyribodipyrimidine photo-lyase
MPSDYPAGLVWFRRDLRAHDHAALHHALRLCGRVHCVFVFDRPILDPLESDDVRVAFIRDSVAELDLLLGGKLIVLHADAAAEIPRLAARLGVAAVFANHDDEPAAIERDSRVRTALARERIAFHTFKDTVVFERDELLTQAGTPYTVFTPYKNAWLAKVDAASLRAFDIDVRRIEASSECAGVPSLEALGFAAAGPLPEGVQPGATGGACAFRAFLHRMDAYADERDFPALDTTSRLSVHLRFGTVSIRELARAALARSRAGSEGAATWLSELVWRDFFFQVLAHFPRVVDSCFRPEFDRLEWEDADHGDELFAAWCEGRTGYPIVDAGMVQMNRTGFMHNRVRMITASFLVKDLGIDWRRGERYFARMLLDYDLAANNGNWQWAASTGCDAQPWFRIFNPETQQKRFDPDGSYVRRWLADRQPVLPVVDHDEARKRTLGRYERARRNGA